MINPLKFLKTEKIATEVEKDVDTMNKANWRTNTHGIVIGLLMLISIWAPESLQPKLQKTEMAFVMLGLISAADAANLKKQ